MKIYLSWTDPQCPNLNLGSVPACTEQYQVKKLKMETRYK